MNDRHLTDQELDAALQAWMRDAPAGRPDRSRVAGHVVGQLHSTRRRHRRWWPFSPSRAVGSTPSGHPRPHRQVSPFQAANGHNTTVFGRTATMFGIAKAVTASALILALGGALFVIQPSGRQEGGPPGAEAEPVEPTWFTGNIARAPSCTGSDPVQDGAVVHDWYAECKPQNWIATDPRFTGKVTARWNEDNYELESGVVTVSSGAYFLQNDGGGWACSTTSLVEGSGKDSEMLTGDTIRCVGEGGYAGQSALLINVDEPASPFVGLIFSGDFPPVPEPPAEE